MKWIIFLIASTTFAAVPSIKAKKVMLPNGDFKIESPVVEVGGKVLPVGYRENFNGVCKTMGGKYSAEVQNARVLKSESANVDYDGNLTGTSNRIIITKSITCKI